MGSGGGPAFGQAKAAICWRILADHPLPPWAPGWARPLAPQTLPWLHSCTDWVACLTPETLHVPTLGLWPGQLFPGRVLGRVLRGIGAAQSDVDSFQLLTVNPKHRVSSLQDMQATPSLAHVLWEDLIQKNVEPGFVPNVSLQAGWAEGPERRGRTVGRDRR